MSKIKSVASYAPSRIVTNDDLSKIVDTNHEWIVTRTGIERRHHVDDETTSDLATKAALKAIEKAQIDPSTIDLIIVATITPDRYSPSVACLVKGKLGLQQTVMAFDINAACSGYVYALTVADALLQMQYRCALVIGAETLSKVLDFTDRSTCILFGDGAGAMILQKSDEKQFLFHYNDSRDDEKDSLYIPRIDYLKMDGRAVFEFAIGAVKKSIEVALETTQLSLDDVDYLVCHQANRRILQKVAKDLGVDLNRFYINIQEYGNTSSASIPIALAEMDDLGLLKKGHKYLLVGFGAGLTWGANLIEW